MEQQAKIFLSEKRGLTQLDWMRSYSTFNFGAYKTDCKTPVGNLYVLNDDTLAGGKSLYLKAEEDTFVIIIPIAGAVEYKDKNGNSNTIIAGQALTAALEGGTAFVVTNPYPEALVNFLQLWVKAPGVQHTTGIREYPFDISLLKNSFATKELAPGIKLRLGKFEGRKKTLVNFNSGKTVFAFAIEGAFELEERLLHARDGLALWGAQAIDMEALSNDAIMLVLEMG